MLCLYHGDVRVIGAVLDHERRFDPIQFAERRERPQQIGDRLGRKPLLLISVALFGLGSLASAVAPSLDFLAGTRFITGAGIAGAFARTVALTGDYAPQRLRATMIMATFTGAPLGGFLVGQAGALLLPHFGWRAFSSWAV